MRPGVRGGQHDRRDQARLRVEEPAPEAVEQVRREGHRDHRRDPERDLAGATHLARDPRDHEIGRWHRLELDGAVEHLAEARVDRPGCRRLVHPEAARKPRDPEDDDPEPQQEKEESMVGIPPIELTGTLRVPRLDIDRRVHRGSVAFAREPRKNLNRGYVHGSGSRRRVMSRGGCNSFLPTRVRRGIVRGGDRSLPESQGSLRRAPPRRRKARRVVDPGKSSATNSHTGWRTRRATAASVRRQDGIRTNRGAGAT